eukprot:12885078-Prorocentrum_lima.AAC.1
MSDLYLVSHPRSAAAVAENAFVSTHCDWQVSDVVVKCDIAKVDTAMENVHAKQTQEGGTLQLY